MHMAGVRTQLQLKKGERRVGIFAASARSTEKPSLQCNKSKGPLLAWIDDHAAVVRLRHHRLSPTASRHCKSRRTERSNHPTYLWRTDAVKHLTRQLRLYPTWRLTSRSRRTDKKKTLTSHARFPHKYALNRDGRLSLANRISQPESRRSLHIPWQHSVTPRMIMVSGLQARH